MAPDLKLSDFENIGKLWESGSHIQKFYLQKHEKMIGAGNP